MARDKKKQARGKPRIHIGTIGHINHEKKTLWSAIQMTLAEKAENSSNENQELTQQEQKNLSNTFYGLMDKEFELIHGVLQSKVDEIKKDGGQQNG